MKLNLKTKTLYDFIDLFGEDCETAGDIRIAGFLIEHGFASRSTSVGLIGASPQSEVMALNALISPPANLVALGIASHVDQYGYLTSLIKQIEGSGFELRLQSADLTLPGRWPNVLDAMARTDVGILGIDARWAASEPGFWQTIQSFMKSHISFVYMRNMLDYEHPEFSFPFIRSMPTDCSLDMIATTPGSVWFASNPSSGAATRDLLRSSGLFARRVASDSDFAISLDAPTVISNESVADVIGKDGRFARIVLTSNASMADGLEYATGWSTVEPDGCWTGAQEAIIKLRLPANLGPQTTLCISGNSWIRPDTPEQVIKIGVGKDPVEWVEMRFADSETISTATINLNGATNDVPTVAVTVKVGAPGRPSDYGGSDTRLLGFKFRSLSIFT
jgi:hypothetical protein